jgi:hypothetical protein
MYCLMGTGNHLDFSPSPVYSYLRDLAGWCDNVLSPFAPIIVSSREEKMIFTDIDAQNHAAVGLMWFGAIARWFF